MKNKLFLSDNDRMPGVVTALIPCDNICTLRKEIRGAAFAFITPLGPPISLCSP